MAKTDGYSARVRMWLECGGRKIQVSHSAGDYVIVAESIEVPPGVATFIFTIDDKRFEREVELIDGIRPDCLETAIRDVQPATTG